MNRFVDEKKEYLITGMYPKRPWVNYAWNEGYVSSFNQFGSGISRYCDKNGLFRNILGPENNRLIFIKDEDTGEYFAANRNFDKKEFDKFETRVGMGYSKISSEYKNIATNLKMFVPKKGFVECWELEVSNTGEEARNISLYAYSDITMGITEHCAYSKADRSDKFNGIYCSHVAFK